MKNQSGNNGTGPTIVDFGSLGTIGCFQRHIPVVGIRMKLLDSQQARRSIFFTALALGSLGGMLFHAQTQAETVKDEQLHFTLDLPDGFAPRPDLIGAMPNIVHAFQYGEIKEGEIPVLLLIEKMGGFMGRQRVTREHLPDGFVGEMFDTTWQGFDVQGVAVHETGNGLEGITYNVQIPLKDEAIQVKLLIPAERKDELKPLLRPILDGLHGESNWSSAAQPGIASSDSYGTILLAVMIGCVLIGLVILWFISRVSPKGTIFLIAVILYLMSWQFGELEGREVRMLEGGMRMLGFAGGILGLIDLLRKRRSASDQANEPKPE